MAQHELQTPTTDDTLAPGSRLIRFACSCGHWWRVFHESMAPRLQDIESAHEDHRQQAGAEDLRTGAISKITPEAGDALDALVQITRALADAAAAGVRAMESMEEFVAAHAAAKDRGIGVTVVRQPDGSIVSTPNVFVQAGTAVFMDSEAISNTLKPGPLRLVPDEPITVPADGLYRLELAAPYQPSYTVVSTPTVA